ncbi:MAG: serine protease [Myxococcales bacterium]
MKAALRIAPAAVCALALCACPPSANQTPAPAPEAPISLGRKVLPITNGVVDDVPSHIAVVAMNHGSRFACSGTLISPRVVLTAAHCVKGTAPSVITIGFGANVDDPSMKWVKVVDAKPHPYYSEGSLANDIAVVRLASSAPEGVAPIPFLPSTKALTAANLGDTVEFSGFGEDEHGGYGVKLKVSDTLDLICERRGGCPWAGETAPQNSLCYDQQPGGPCSGDSGGPAFLTVDGIEYVVGVTSWGDTACVSDGCSTNATPYEDWINGYIGAAGTAEDGAPCTEGKQCLSSFCADGVCCSSACTDECMGCSLAVGATADGTCSPVTEPCDDGKQCTVDDQCVAGRCVGTPSCPAPDSCHLGSTCLVTGQCSTHQKRPDGVSCDDGDECVLGGQCADGVCRGEVRLTCPAPSSCLQDAVCANGRCGEFQPKDDGSSCDDGDACTHDDACGAGACKGTPTVCATGPCHAQSRCDAATGECVPGAALADGLPCDDGLPCTQGDQCLTGECKGTLQTGACEALDGCHAAGTCRPDGTCHSAPLDDGAACEEGNPCTVGDQCQAGACVAGTAKECAPPDACHVGNTCDPETGECQWAAASTGTPCDDGNLCTKNDACSGLTCAGTAVGCEAAPACQRLNGCNPRTGQCEYNWLEDGTTCESGQCESGKCQTTGCGCSTGSEPVTLAMALLAVGLMVRRRQGR